MVMLVIGNMLIALYTKVSVFSVAIAILQLHDCGLTQWLIVTPLRPFSSKLSVIEA